MSFGFGASKSWISRIGEALLQLVHTLNGRFCRYGGEEFLGLFFDKDLDYIIDCANEIQCAVRRLELRSACKVSQYVTISLGLSVHPDLRNERDLIHLIEESDEALYHAKNNGRNQWAVYQEREREAYEDSCG